MQRRDGSNRPAGLVPALVLAAALIAAALLYAPTISGGFLSDDYWYIDQAQTVTFSEHPIESLRKGNFYYFRPLPSLGWSVLYNMFGLESWAYRLSSLLLHLAATGALFLLGRRALKSELAASTAALVFAIHPLFGEAVVWVSANSDLFAALFVCLSLERYLKWREKGPEAEEKNGPLYAAYVLGALAMMSKESAFVLPAFFILSEIPPDSEKDAKKRLQAVGGMIAIAAVLFGVKFVAGMGQLRPPTGAMPLMSFPGNAGMALVRFVAPAARGEYAQAANLVTAVCLLGLSVLAYLGGNLNRRALFGLLFLLVGVLPPSTVTRLGPLLEFSRTMYLPAMGMALFVGALLAPSEKIKSWIQPARAVVFSALAAVLMFSAYANLEPWVEAGRASLALESDMANAGEKIPPGSSVLMERVPVVYRGVPFHSNSYTLSVAFSVAAYPESFQNRGYESKNDLPVYAIGAETPEVEARMTHIKELRDLKRSPPDAFDYRLVWDSVYAAGAEK